MGSCARLGLTFLLAASLLAERLPVKVYTTADGLARNRVQGITADSRGYLWISTAEGLSLFDGYRFVNYGTRDGLASRVINAVLEARDGTYWVATEEGLCVLHPRNPRQLFTLYHRPQLDFLHSVNGLLQDHTGAIWAATDMGLFRESHSGAPTGERPEWIDLGAPREGDLAQMRTIVEDRQGSVWIGGATGLYRRFPDGRVETYSTENGLPTTFVERLLVDNEGRIWAGTRQGLCRIVADPQPGRKIVERVYTDRDGLCFPDIKSLALSPDGSVWAGCLGGGLSQVHPGGEGPTQIHTYAKAQGLTDETIIALAHDQIGNLWVGGESGGLMRIARNGFLTYTTADGLPADRTEEILEDRDNELCVIARSQPKSHAYLSRFTGKGFESFPFPPQYQWPWVPVLQDHRGNWWAAGVGRLVRLGAFPVQHLPYAQPAELFADMYKPGETGVFRLFEDSTGAIWASYAGRRNGVARWREATGLTFFPPTNGPTEQLVSAFAEDLAGNVWLGLYGRGVVRFHQGTFTQFGTKDGIPAGFISRLFVDQAGRLWIASADGGLGRIDQPSAEHPAVRIYDTSHGISGDSISTITDDQWGRIYVGTGRGVDRLDPATDRVKHYTIADGLANDQPAYSLRDHNNWLWFGTTKGISRLIPEPDQQRPPPSIHISRLTVAGHPYAISQIGETALDGLEFRGGDVQIEFSSVNFEAGEVLLYQYRIDRAGGQWSVPVDQRSVNLAGLSPGPYRFEVRALDSRGQVSETPASIAFRIPPPVWGQAWFRLLVLAGIALVLYGLYRFRLDRMLELEHIRTRIATDLHDDIGSSLSQIAILSEVARRPGEAGSEALDPLGRIAAISRELVDSMGDIVWAVNPKRDNLLDLTRRMRQFAGEMLVPGGIEFSFDAAGASGSVALGADLRRQVFLIFKECLNNAARHSGATQVDIAFEMSGGWLRLTVCDDGHGFDPATVSNGHGLMSMCRRAATLHGTLRIESAPGKGTSARLEIPLGKRRIW